MNRIFQASIIGIFLMSLSFSQISQACTMTIFQTSCSDTYSFPYAGYLTVKINESGACGGSYRIAGPGSTTNGSWGNGGVSYSRYFSAGSHKVTLTKNSGCPKAQIVLK